MGNADSKIAAELAAPPEASTVLNEKKFDADTANFHNEEKKEPELARKQRSKTAKSGKGKSGRGHEQSATSRMASHAVEDQVQVNMPMADLMAYLQVVANNSNHLPLTQRDDPELERTVSALTSEDYAKKSAAFIPSDVRVIGGVFTRYGRVWDLPTTEEYSACDGAHEPGRSYGGACANSMLKVLYDAVNDTVDTSQQDVLSNALFDDDDDEATDDGYSMAKSFRSGFSLDNGPMVETTLTWANLLRKMKAEMKEVEYVQIPKLSTTRKLDLNQPFSLLPENFDPSKNKKRALLIGCNYSNVDGAELKASHDDIRSMKDYIVNVHGFPESGPCMTVLLDDADHEHPTFENITEAFKRLSEQCQPGDAVFVQFSGHGGRVLDSHTDEEAESYDEVITPVDYQTTGMIRDTLIFKTLLAPMRYGVTLTVIIDTCDTGMMVELPYAWTTRKDRREETPKLAVNDDFSFVRFLKVVKTLYETSTFTQLGKTVNTVLQDNEGEDLVEADSSHLDTDDESERVRQESVFETMHKACLLSAQSAHGKNGFKKKGGKAGDESLLEQLLNTCSVFTHPEGDDLGGIRSSTDNFSDEEDRKMSSFETISDDESDQKRPRSKRR